MGRAPRIQAPDAVYHVTARGVRRERVYEDAVDYKKFEKLLGSVVTKREWVVHAYCQMPNHYHLLVNTPHSDISDGMCWLNGVYARWFNERHDYLGHVFEARFHTVLVRSSAHVWNLAWYIPMNPVRAKLCASPADWRWSSYRATVERVAASWMDASWLLAQFAPERAAAVREYERFVETRLSA